MEKSLSQANEIVDHSLPENDRRNQSAGIPDGLEAGRRPGDNKSFITFYLGDQLIGIPIEKVQEILTVQDICHVPLAPKAVSGLLNLRGQIVTVIDLRKRLDLSPIEDRKEAMNIVVAHEGELFSFQVDTVGDVLEVRRDIFEPAPPTLDSCWGQCCEGVYRLKKGLLIILSVPLLLEIDPTNGSEEK